MSSPPITIGQLTNVPAPNSPMASAWAQDVSKRVVQRFVSFASLNSLWPPATAGQGAVASIDGTQILYRSDGTTWNAVAQGAVGGEYAWSPTLPGLASGGIIQPSYTAATDPQGFLSPGTTFTCPAGFGGIYAFGYRFYTNLTPDQICNLTLNTSDSRSFATVLNATQTKTAGTFTFRFDAGQSFYTEVYNGSTGTIQFNVAAHLIRVATL